MTKSEWQYKLRTLKSQQYQAVKARFINSGMIPRLAAFKAHSEVYDKEGK